MTTAPQSEEIEGRAAELIELHRDSAESTDNLAQTTELATKMVRALGLPSALGPIGYPVGGLVFLGGEGPGLSSHPFAEATQGSIDAEVAKLLCRAEARAWGLLALTATSCTNWLIAAGRKAG